MAWTPVGSIIDVLKKQLGLDEKIFAVMQIWERELGPLAEDARLAAIHRGQLIVEVSSSAHFQELNLRRREIISKINQHFGKEKVVKGIKIKLKSGEING